MPNAHLLTGEIRAVWVVAPQVCRPPSLSYLHNPIQLMCLFRHSCRYERVGDTVVLSQRANNHKNYRRHQTLQPQIFQTAVPGLRLPFAIFRAFIFDFPLDTCDLDQTGVGPHQISLRKRKMKWSEGAFTGADSHPRAQGAATNPQTSFSRGQLWQLICRSSVQEQAEDCKIFEREIYLPG